MNIMNSYYRRAVSLIACLLFSASSYGANVKNKGEDELQKTIESIDRLWVGDASEATLEMEVKTKNYNRNLNLRYWVKGKKNTLVLITGPKKEKGTATLKIANDMYNYLPKTARTIKISSALRGGSWMGSHFTNDDLIRSSLLSETYHSRITKKEKLKGDEIWHIEFIAKPDAATPWGKILMELNQSKLIPIKQEYFDEDQKLVRTIIYSDVKKMGDRTLPTVIKVMPKSLKGEFTKLTYRTINYNVSLEDSFFSLTKLKDL